MSPVLDDESFVYDLLGNRLNGGATFDKNNALLSVDEAVFEYDLNGNLVRKSVGSEVRFFVYDVGDRLIRVEDGSGGVVAEYFYDPFGRRLFKEVEGVRTYFVYSDEGLVGEFDEGGVELRGYGFRPNSTWTTNPLFLKVGGEYFWFLNDHLGTPQKIVDEQGGVVWEAVYESFGKARVDLEIVESHLRFAGQYFDLETGLYYNWHRFYDPEMGRYFRVDPVWGVNLYGYANGNPVIGIDPTGEWVQIPVGIGLWITFDIILPSFQKAPPFDSGVTVPAGFPLDVFVMKSAICRSVEKNTAKSLWESRPPGIQVRQYGDWWVKRTDPNSNQFLQWWGRLSMKAQADGLKKLGDIGAQYQWRNGKLFVRDVGETLPDGFRLLNPKSRQAYFEGSRRLGTYLNDIQPRNIGKNGLIFDPALDALTKAVGLGGLGAGLGGGLCVQFCGGE